VRRYQNLGRLIFVSVARAGVVLAVVLPASACGDSPARPAPVPTPDTLALTCPVSVSQLSPTGQSIGIRYGTATATGGTPPVQITCAPASDTFFSVGRTTVTCTGADTKGATASCSFTVSVTAPPTITLTQYLAFGDSITAGEITVVGEGGIHTLQVIPALSYPTDLRASLASRYTAQSIGVLNQGVKGENTAMGVSRLPSALGGYQVLLLMEGANDINNASDAAVLTALSNMRAMVRLAKGRGLRVFLGTLPPQNPIGCNPCRAGGAAQLPSYNLGLKAIAASESVPLVDVFAAFTDLTTLIGPDGLHPTAQGYRVMAEAFFNTIRTALEIPGTSLAPSSLRAPFVVAPWRR
jgi:lysophospholipase L1-like esterase